MNLVAVVEYLDQTGKSVSKFPDTHEDESAALRETLMKYAPEEALGMLSDGIPPNATAGTESDELYGMMSLRNM